MAVPYWEQIRAAAERRGVPASYLAGLLGQESGFNPKAVGDNNNSFGMGQFNTRGALKEAGLTPEEMLAMPPEGQIDLAAWFYKKKLEQADGDPIAALKLYNGGGDPKYVERVQRRMAQYGFPEAGGTSAASTPPVDPRTASTLPPGMGDYAVPPQSLPGRLVEGAPPPGMADMQMPPQTLGDRLSQDPILQMGLGIMAAKQGTGSLTGSIAEGISAGLGNAQKAELLNAQQAHQLLTNRAVLQDPAAVRTIQYLVSHGASKEDAIAMVMKTGALGGPQYIPRADGTGYDMVQPARNAMGESRVTPLPGGPPPSVTKNTPEGAAAVKSATVSAGDAARAKEIAKTSLPKIQAGTQQALIAIDRVLNHAGKSNALGFARKLTRWASPQDSADFETAVSHITGIEGRQAVNDLANTGLGRILLTEVQSAQAAIANLNLDQSPEQFDQAAHELRSWVRVMQDKAEWAAKHNITEPEDMPDFGHKFREYMAEYQGPTKQQANAKPLRSLPPPSSEGMQAPPQTTRRFERID